MPSAWDKIYHVPYKCPKGGNCQYKRVKVRVPIPFSRKKKTRKAWRRQCEKCGRFAGERKE